jgi:cation/acetate symporter
MKIFKERADAADAKLKDVPAAMAADKAAAEKKVADLKAANAPVATSRPPRRPWPPAQDA